MRRFHWQAHPTQIIGAWRRVVQCWKLSEPIRQMAWIHRAGGGSYPFKAGRLTWRWRRCPPRHHPWRCLRSVDGANGAAGKWDPHPCCPPASTPTSTLTNRTITKDKTNQERLLLVHHAHTPPPFSFRRTNCSSTENRGDTAGTQWRQKADANRLRRIRERIGLWFTRLALPNLTIR